MQDRFLDEDKALLLGSGWTVNFGLPVGGSGFGIRDNAGTIEIKNSGGDWAAPGGGTPDLSTVPLLAGRAGGQTLNGGTESGENLQVYSNPSKDGKIGVGDNLIIDDATGLITQNGRTLMSDSFGNIIIGPDPYQLGILKGKGNIVIGDSNGDSLTYGAENLLIGKYVGENISMGSWNVALGFGVFADLGWGPTYKNITSLTDKGSEGTTVHCAGHGYSEGDSILIGVDGPDSSMNGIRNIFNVTQDTFDVAIRFSVDLSGMCTKDFASYNTAIGRQAGESLTAGSRNVYLGYLAGSGAPTTESDRLYISSGQTANPLIYGEFDQTGGLNQKLKINGHLQIANQSAPVAAVADTKLLNSTAPNADLTLTGPLGTAGAGTKVALHNTGGTNGISVAVTEYTPGKSLVTVTLATTGGAITSTAADVKGAIDGDTGASALIPTVTVEGTGLGVVDAFETGQELTGGNNATVAGAGTMRFANGNLYLAITDVGAGDDLTNWKVVNLSAMGA